MDNVLETLKERGFIHQCTDEVGLSRLLSESTLCFYVGFDCTADSLHVGSLLPIMAMAHLQRAGHKPVAVIGGGTTLVGDPSGKSEMRRLMPQEEIEQNAEFILGQLSRYLDLNGESGVFLNNADWLMPLNYIQFLRDVGQYFKVNEMLRMEAYRQRLDRQEGLSFIEFNYQLLQAYDFLVLSRRHNCILQMGGGDQWGNIVAGIDLIKKVRSKSAFGITFPLLTTAGGSKMGKTEKGAIWLSEDKTSPYDFYQYWMNVDDRDVHRFLAYFTFLSMDEIRRLGSLKGSSQREAKEILAYEVTKLAHSEEEATSALLASQAAFGGQVTDMTGLPTSTISEPRLRHGIPIVDLIYEIGMVKSRGEARRLVQQGGAYINDAQVKDPSVVVTEQDLQGESLLLRSGKKRYHRIVTSQRQNCNKGTSAV